MLIFSMKTTFLLYIEKKFQRKVKTINAKNGNYPTFYFIICGNSSLTLS